MHTIIHILLVQNLFDLKKAVGRQGLFDEKVAGSDTVKYTSLLRITESRCKGDTDHGETEYINKQVTRDATDNVISH